MLHAIAYIFLPDNGQHETYKQGDEKKYKQNHILIFGYRCLLTVFIQGLASNSKYCASQETKCLRIDDEVVALTHIPSENKESSELERKPSSEELALPHSLKVFSKFFKLN